MSHVFAPGAVAAVNANKNTDIRRFRAPGPAFVVGNCGFATFLTSLVANKRSSERSDDALCGRRPLLEVVARGRWRTHASVLRYSQPGQVQKLATSLKPSISANGGAIPVEELITPSHVLARFSLFFDHPCIIARSWVAWAHLPHSERAELCHAVRKRLVPFAATQTRTSLSPSLRSLRRDCRRYGRVCVLTTAPPPPRPCGVRGHGRDSFVDSSTHVA